MQQSHRPGVLAAAVVAALASMASIPAQAFEFRLANDEVTGSLDTNITYGAMWRVQSRDPQLAGISNGGSSRSVNDDDGNVNYDAGDLVSSLLKVSHDLGVKYKNFGVFTRALYFFDSAIHDMDDCPAASFPVECARGLVPEAKKRLGDDAQFLDAYVYGQFDVGGRKLNARLGNQVVNWGESTFIPNGINSANPVDVARLRAPGSEVKEGLLPVQMLWASQEVTDAISVEGFYQFNFKKTKIDPRGSFFSSNDLLSPGGDIGFLGFGRRWDQHFPFVSAFAAPGGQAWITRDPDREAKDSGQFGLGARLLVPEWSNTEFGLFFMNYHSRTPFLSGVSGGDFTGAPNLLNSQLVTTGGTSYTAGTGGLARVFSDYPEDIQMYGLSVNTAGPFGMALQGEYSYRPKQPLQLATLEVLLGLVGLQNRAGIPFTADTGALPAGTIIPGYREVPMHQLQMTATKSFGPQLGAGQVVAVGEVGYSYLDLPSGLLFSGPGTHLPSQGSFLGLSNGSGQPGDQGYATKSSWGYRVLVNATYSNAIAEATLLPRVVFSHDVNGVGPTFNKGTKALSVGLGMNYRQNWQADLSYTTFFGGRTYSGTDAGPPPVSPVLVAQGQSLDYAISANPLKDRDFIAVSLSYAF